MTKGKWENLYYKVWVTSKAQNRQVIQQNDCPVNADSGNHPIRETSASTISFICVCKQAWAMMTLASGSDISNGNMPQIVLMQFSNLLHVDFLVPCLVLCPDLECDIQIVQIVDFILAYVPSSFCLLSTCQPQWPADMSFGNLISQRKRSDLMLPPAFCHSGAAGA